MPDYQATVIISVYRDTAALACILRALEKQTEPRIEVIVSEDGQYPDVRAMVHARRNAFGALVHLTQEDLGFRKNRALNRAIRAARSPRLLFLDGDCIPHRQFVENHVRRLRPGIVCVGRRVQLGPRLSRWLVGNPAAVDLLSRAPVYLLLAPLAYLDGAKHYAVGVASRWLQALRRRKPGGLLGCNFSVHREDLARVNGFDERYEHPGGGEDADIQWRLERCGVGMDDVRFLVPVYHLYHDSRWSLSPQNRRLLEQNRQGNEVYSLYGMDRHRGSLPSRDISL